MPYCLDLAEFPNGHDSIAGCRCCQKIHQKALVYNILRQEVRTVDELAAQMTTSTGAARAILNDLRRVGVVIFSAKVDGEQNYAIVFGPRTLAGVRRSRRRR